MSSGDDIKNVQQKLRDMEKSNEDLQNKLTKKEREIEIKTDEKVNCGFRLWLFSNFFYLLNFFWTIIFIFFYAPWTISGEHIVTVMSVRLPVCLSPSIQLSVQIVCISLSNIVFDFFPS